MILHLSVSVLQVENVHKTQTQNPGDPCLFFFFFWQKRHPAKLPSCLLHLSFFHVLSWTVPSHTFQFTEVSPVPSSALIQRQPFLFVFFGCHCLLPPSETGSSTCFLNYFLFLRIIALFLNPLTMKFCPLLFILSSHSPSSAFLPLALSLLSHF